MGFSRQEYWSGLPWPPPEDLPNTGIKPRSPALQADSFTIRDTREACVSAYVYICTYTCIDLHICVCVHMGFPGGSTGKESACNAGHTGLVPGIGRPDGEGNGNLLQYSCLEISMDRGAWQTTGHSVAKSWTRLSN